MVSDFLQRSGSGFRLRLQILLATCCALLPFASYNWLPLGEQSMEILMVTLVGGLVASALSLFFVRNVNAYPGVEGSAYIIPSFGIGFGIVILIYFFARFDYSRLLFLLIFVLNVFCFYVAYFMVQRRARIIVGMVPGSYTAKLAKIEQIQWVPLTTPVDDARFLTAVVADLRAELSADWDARLADFALAGVPVYHSKHLYESLSGRVELEHLSENSFGMLSPVSAYMRIKHALDWLAALILGIVMFPFLVVVAILIMLDSPGSPIFRQRRVGYRGKAFTVWKFRTMTAVRPEGESLRAAAMTKSNDMRITRIGRFLRTSRIDELPQVVNVLKGEMSWIGPRPEAEVLSQWYEAEIPFYRYRHIVRPGITGWAQVNQGHVADVDDVREKLHYDFYYIKNFSPWIDVLICARTIRTMLTGFGAR